MSITVDLAPDLEAQLHQRAVEKGCNVKDYVEQLIECDLSAKHSLKEILAPSRRGFEESGMTEEELTALFEEAREEVWREKQAGRK